MIWRMVFGRRYTEGGSVSVSVMKRIGKGLAVEVVGGGSVEGEGIKLVCVEVQKNQPFQ